MANVFKVITKDSVGVGSGNATTLITVPSSKTEVILSLMLANKHTTSIKTSVLIESNTTQAGGSANGDAYVIKDVSIEEETSLEIMSGQKYVLNTTDVLKVFADNANIYVVLSYMEQDV